MIPQQFIDELNRDTDLVGLIGRYVKLSKKGNSYVGLCPFHNEKTPSFNVVPEKGFYHCFGCGASGSALGFLMRIAYGGDFLPAVEELARQLGREVPRSGGSQKEANLRRKAEELLEQIQSFYSSLLRRSRKPIEYLKNERGISKETAMRFGMGYSPRGGGLNQALGDGYDENLLIFAGMLKRSEDKSKRPYVYFRDRITIPIQNGSGNTVGFGARSLDGSEPKYLNSPQSAVFDKSRLVYGLHLATPGIKEEGFALVVEGYMDVIVLAENGFANAVATMGTAATAAQMRSILTRTDRCIFCFDGDEAGRRAAAKALGNCMSALSDGKELIFAFLPQGEDPDSYVRANGKEAFADLLNNGLELSAMLVDPDQAGDAGQTEAQKVRRWHEAAELIERLDTTKAPLLKELLYSKLAEASGIDVGALKTAAENLKRDQPPERPEYYEQDAGQSKERLRANKKMSDHELLRLLNCLAAKPELVDRLDVPLSRPSEADAKLCEDVIAYLRSCGERKQGDVLEYLGTRGLIRLSRQIHISLYNQQGRGFDWSKEFDGIKKKMRNENEMKAKRERVRLLQKGRQ